MIFSWTGNRGGQGSAHNFQRAPGKFLGISMGGGLEGGMNLKTNCLCFFFEMWMMLTFVVQHYN